MKEQNQQAPKVPASQDTTAAPEKAAPRKPKPPVTDEAAPKKPKPPVTGEAAPKKPKAPVTGEAAPKKPKAPVTGEAAPKKPKAPTTGKAASKTTVAQQKEDARRAEIARRAAERRAKKRKRERRRKLIFGILLLVFVMSAFYGLRALYNSHNSEKHFEKLSAMVDNYVPETAQPQETLPEQTVPPTFVPPVQPAESVETLPPETLHPEPTEPQILDKYVSLYDQNNDFFGWLKIDGTRMDYPVMHSPDDPEKYLHANFEAKYSYAGTPFLDAACTGNSDNLIIYGHNMSDGSMFAGLMNYQQKNYWEEHPTITFNTLYEEQEYEVVAAFYDRVYYKSETCFKFYQFINAADEADFEYAMQNYREKRLYDTGVEAEYGDQLITLVTCAYHVDNGRFVVVARKK